MKKILITISLSITYLLSWGASSTILWDGDRNESVIGSADESTISCPCFSDVTIAGGLSTNLSMHGNAVSLKVSLYPNHDNEKT